MESVRDYCRSILEQPTLADKLRTPPADLVDVGAHEPYVVHQPARAGLIAMRRSQGGHGGDKLPKPAELRDPVARAVCLSRFAHHELQAVELFAWALLAFPDLPTALRRGLVATLGEEQEHCRLYLDRLAAHDMEFGAVALSGYLWQSVERIVVAEHPPLAFLCVQGLTFEQANLDFTLLFRDAFASAGDAETAQVCDRVHREEIAHVKLAATWVKKMSSLTDVDAYRAHAPFPFSLARAKGRRFDVKARQRAGLSADMIDAVRAARPYHDAAE